MLIDCHTHLGKYNNRDFSPKTLIDSMDESEIDYSLVYANRSTKNSHGLSVDTLLTLCEDYPRLKVIGSIDFGVVTTEQIDHLINLLETKKILGIKIYPGYENFYLLDSKLTKIYDYCQEHAYPVIIHTGIQAIYKIGGGYLEQSHPLQVDRMAIHYPHLKIVMAHMGNPWFVDTAAVLYRHKNVYTDMSGFFTEFSTISGDNHENFREDVTSITKYVGGFRKFLFGTDYPLYSQKEYLEAVKILPMTDSEKELVFYKNAQMLFNLSG